jgi:hypothetical protein
VKRWALMLLLAGLAEAHEPITTKLTWTREISRIFYKRCAGCHHEGGRAPMALVTYEQARPWAKAVRDEVLERRMPPWGPVKGFGDFRNDASLSEPEIQMIVNWVEGGAPEGEEIYVPSIPNLDTKTEAAPPSERFELQTATILSRDVTAIGIEPDGPVQIIAALPDGRIEPLIWVRVFSPLQPKAYYFRDPLQLPKGSRIQKTGGAPARLLAK